MRRAFRVPRTYSGVRGRGRWMKKEKNGMQDKTAAVGEVRLPT